MNEAIILKGGALIGRRYASSPFVKLFVDKDVLKIEDFFLGRYVFLPQDIISIEPTIDSYLGKGIKINHRIENYNPTVIFCTSKDPNFIITEIKNIGFLNKINSKISFADTEIFKRQQRENNPIKKPVAILLFVLLSIIIVLHILTFFFMSKEIAIVNHIGVKTVIVLLFATSILTLISNGFRKLILKEGTDFNDLKPFICVIIFYSGIMLLS